MTLRAIRRLQRGHLTSLAGLVGAGLVVALLAVAGSGPHRAPGEAPQVAAPVPAAVPPPGTIRMVAGTAYTFIPTSAHQPGQNGANWRTDVAVHNPGQVAAAYTFALLKRGTDNAAPPSQSFTLGPGLAARYTDIVDSVFHFTGAAALRLSVTAGAVLVTSRTYNLIGANPWSLPVGASFGQLVPGFADDQAIGAQQEGRLIQLSHLDPNALEGFRTNLGILNATAGTIDTVIELYDANATRYGTVQGADTQLRAYEYKQLDRIFERVTTGQVADGYAIVRTTTAGGAFFTYASVIDNHRSGDSVFIPAFRLAKGSSPPTPTPTRTATGVAPTKTRTPTATATTTGSFDLVVYKPSNWPGCVVCNYRGNCCPPSTEALSTATGTAVMFAVGNAGTATLTGPVRFMIRLDGVDRWTTTWSNSSGLAPNSGAGLTVSDLGITTPGQHLVTVEANHDHAIPEPDYSDNACSFTGTWTSVAPAPGAAAAREASVVQEVELGELGGPLPPPVRPDLGGPTLELPWGACGTGHRQVALAAAGEVLVFPTSAHQPGQNGASWRSDAEAHNPGTTAAGFTIALLKRNTDNASPATRSFTLAAGRSVRLVDLVDSEFHFTGAAALRLTVTSGTVLFTSRTYNQIGANPWSLPVGASFGQFVPAFPVEQAIGDGQEGRIIQLSHRDPNTLEGFRTNLGYVNVTAGTIELVVDLFLASGVHLGTVSGADTQLRAWEYKQLDRIFERVTGGAVEDGYAVVWSRTAGARFLAYGSVIDNHRSGDAVFVPAFRLARGGAVTTPTPTRTRTVTPVKTPTGPAPTRTPTGPTRTPTRTPTGPTRTPTRTSTVGPTPPTAGQVELANEVMEALGSIGAAFPNVQDLVTTAKLNGVDALFTQIRNLNPNVYTKTANGLKADYGSGYVEQTGVTVSGSMTLEKTSFVVSGNRVTGSFVLTPSNLKKDGRPVPVGKVTLSSDFTLSTGSATAGVGATSSVVGDLSGSAVSPSNPSQTIATGSVHYDSTKCEKYPVSGGVTTTIDGVTKTFSIGGTCDGGYSFTDPNAEVWMLLVEDTLDNPCTFTNFAFLMGGSALNENGVLVADPRAMLICTQQNGPGCVNTVSGTLTATAVNVRISYGKTHSSSGKGSLITVNLTAPRTGSTADGRPKYAGTGSWTFTDLSTTPPCTLTGSGPTTFFKCKPGELFCFK